MAQPEVLIVGAGPTGLVLALQLAQRGIRFKIIDKKSGPGENSRAMVVHARTLEFYRQQGIAEEVIAEGIIAEKAIFRRDLKQGFELNFTEFGKGQSPYPFFLLYPQDDHEKFLIRKLKALGIEVEWNVELKSFTQNQSEVRAVLASPSGEQELLIAYICGCDGARSQVRHTLNLGFEGGTYGHLFYVADVKLKRGASPALVLNLSPRMLTLKFPVRLSGMYRLIGSMPFDANAESTFTFEDIRPMVEPLADVKVKEVNWFSTYHVHHRVADHFRVGRAFLAGDAGHIHSPAGGQGMNTGIGDAVNLSWKLANVLRGRANESILETYESERIRFARILVKTTDRAFRMIASAGIAGKLVRSFFFPYVFPLLLRLSITRRNMFAGISQIAIRYGKSRLSRGSAGSISGGDRLPWYQPGAGADNFAPLASLDWQLHVYGEISPELHGLADELKLAVHVFSWERSASAAGFPRDTAFLIRPDGYIALVLGKHEARQLKAFVAEFGLKFN